MEFSRWVVMRASVFLWLMGLIKRMTIGVRGIVVDGDKVLLVRHSYIPGWHFPGGGVDPGEVVEDSMVREIFEETGIRVAAPYRLVGMYRNTIPPGRDHVAVYVCEQFALETEFTPNKEIVEIGWFDRNDLPVTTSKATRARIAEIFGEATPNWLWND